MTDELVIEVVGTPGPQGSKKGWYNQHTGRVHMAESSKKVKPWRQDVRDAALTALGDRLPLTGPVDVDIEFRIARPKHHFGTGRNQGVLKATAPTYVATRPDVDKYERSTLDALKDAGVYGDDGQVARLFAVKVYATHPLKPGAVITVRPLVGVARVPESQGEGDEGARAASVQEALL